MKTLSINQDTAEGLIFGNELEDGTKYVTVIRGDEHRWYFDMVLVVEKDGVFYGAEYVDDKTEMGELSFWEYQTNPILFKEMEAKEIVTIQYEYVS